MYIYIYVCVYIYIYISGKRDEYIFTLESNNELKKGIKTLEDAWDKIKNY